DLDLVLLMSVNPGFGGQVFIKQTYAKIAKLRQMIDDCKSPALIQIDGGVSLDNAGALYRAGADVLVSGSFIFKSPRPKEIIEQIKKAE
ncbi:MAG TPA: ribulose-phosphate 3-epimerase, partial [Bacteroidales bacterium]|nr:ribulose-phosphate 3-epimerase [Bacteroidales bacterium]